MLKPAYRFGMVMKRGLREQEEPLVLKGRQGSGRWSGLWGKRLSSKKNVFRPASVVMARISLWDPLDRPLQPVQGRRASDFVKNPIP